MCQTARIGIVALSEIPGYQEGSWCGCACRGFVWHYPERNNCRVCGRPVQDSETVGPSSPAKCQVVSPHLPLECLVIATPSITPKPKCRFGDVSDVFKQTGCLVWGMFSEYDSRDCECCHPQVMPLGRVGLTMDKASCWPMAVTSNILLLSHIIVIIINNQKLQIDIFSSPNPSF